MSSGSVTLPQTGGGGSGITSINGDTTAAQVIAGGTGISVSTAAGTTTVTNTAPSSGGTVTSVSVTTANGVSGSVANPTTTPAISLSLGAITPASVAATGTVTGSNLSGTNTGDQTITLTGDVTGSGTGSFPATLTQFADRVYVDFNIGDDTTGTGTPTKPWKTLQHAYNSISPTLNQPYTIWISGGNNDTDVGPIIAKPNVNLYSEAQIQINPAFTVTGGTSNDVMTFTNIIFIGAFTWVRNDATVISATFINCFLFNGPTIKNTGTGSSGVNLYLTTTINADLLISNGAFSVVQASTFLGTTTFEDSTTASFYQIIGSYFGGPVSFAGGAEVYLSGNTWDTGLGATLTLTTTANGTPNLVYDSNGLPPSVTGTIAGTQLSQAKYVAYTPAVPANWTVVPTTVAEALDRIAAKIGPV